MVIIAWIARALHCVTIITNFQDGYIVVYAHSRLAHDFSVGFFLFCFVFVALVRFAFVLARVRTMPRITTFTSIHTSGINCLKVCTHTAKYRANKTHPNVSKISTATATPTKDEKHENVCAKNKK